MTLKRRLFKADVLMLITILRTRFKLVFRLEGKSLTARVNWSMKQRTEMTDGDTAFTRA